MICIKQFQDDVEKDIEFKEIKILNDMLKWEIEKHKIHKGNLAYETQIKLDQD